MAGEGVSDLNLLLKAMSPQLEEGRFVILHTSGELNLNGLSGKVIWQGLEREGTTAIVEIDETSTGDSIATPIWKMITLNVHSSLEAIGFLAAILPSLACEGIGVNVFSGYFHDHLLIPIDRAQDAIKKLKQISEEIP